LLHYAAYYGRLDLVGELLDRGADIHARDIHGHDALMWACSGGHEDLAMVTLLLDRGANLLAVSNYAESALHFQHSVAIWTNVCCCSREAPI